MSNFINIVIFLLLSCFVYSFLYYLLFRLFDFLGFKKIALYCLAISDAPLFCWHANKIRMYCRKHFPNKKCDKCIYWTCESDKNGGEK